MMLCTIIAISVSLLILASFTYRRRIRTCVATPILLLIILFIPVHWLRTVMPDLLTFNKPRDRSPLSGIYVGSAYRVSDSEIRFYYFENTEIRNGLLYLDGDSWRKVHSTCICPLSTLLSQCTVEGFLGIARVTLKPAIKQLYVTAQRGAEAHSIEVVDVRHPRKARKEKYKYPHQLGVCIMPIYYHADWTIFIQFFEFWIASGATKFYVYLHSSTPQVNSILDYYSSLLGDGLEVIPWSDLPVSSQEAGDFFVDPNTRVFRAGGYAALNDCLLRARWHVKFAALLDVDEVMYAPGTLDLITRLNLLADKHPEAATFALPWRYVNYHSRSGRISRPHQLTFNDLVSIRIPMRGSVNSEYNDLMKIVQRPEKVVMSDIHNTLINELKSRRDSAAEALEAERYEQVTIDESLASVLHLRRFQPLIPGRTVSYNDSVPSDLLAPITKMMYKGWISRKPVHNISMGVWWPTQEQTMRDLEQCRIAPFNTKSKFTKGMCRSLANCEPQMRVRDSFIKVQQVWIDVASRKRFRHYIG